MIEEIIKDLPLLQKRTLEFINLKYPKLKSEYLFFIGMALDDFRTEVTFHLNEKVKESLK